MIVEGASAKPTGGLFASLLDLLNMRSAEAKCKFDCIGMPVYVYVVLTVTDEGSDVAAVYDNQAAAMEHVKMRFDKELEYYRSSKNCTYFDELIEPVWDRSGGSAYIQRSDDDFWSWTVVKVPLRSSAILSSRGGVSED